MTLKVESLLPLALGAVLLAGAFYVAKKGVAGAAAGAVSAVADAAAGAVLGLGDSLGLPRRDEQKYSEAIANGDPWTASFYGAPAEGALALAQTPFVLIGDAVGVPRTNLTECERAKAEGRTLDASFKCGAGDFLSYLFK